MGFHHLHIHNRRPLERPSWLPKEAFFNEVYCRKSGEINCVVYYCDRIGNRWSWESSITILYHGTLGELENFFTLVRPSSAPETPKTLLIPAENAKINEKELLIAV